MFYEEQKAEHNQSPEGGITKWETRASSQVYYIIVSMKEQPKLIQES